MANEQNLMPIELVNARKTREERRESASKAGKASGEAKRRRKAMKEQMEMLLSLPFNLKDKNGNDVIEALSSLGIEKDNIDNQMALIISLWKTAINSNSSQQIQAVKEIREIVQDNHIVNEENRVQIVNDLPEDDEDDS